MFDEQRADLGLEETAVVFGGRVTGQCGVAARQDGERRCQEQWEMWERHDALL